MSLFGRKNCDICGGKIGLFGNRKVEDGNVCKECAGKLSPWFSDRRRSTLEDIKAQLAYREENKALVNSFNTTRTLGKGTKIYLDEGAGLLMVTSARNPKEANPDVLKFSQVTGCEIEIEEDEEEIMREIKESDGSTMEVSYDPPRYMYSYDFYANIHVNTPFFNEIRFRLNDSTIEIEDRGAVRGRGADFGMRDGRQIRMQASGDSNVQGIGDLRMQNLEYVESQRMGEEIREAMLGLRGGNREAQEASEPAESAGQSGGAAVTVKCPYCDATTTPDAAGKCEYCGAVLSS